MTTTATHNAHDTTPGRALFVAFELSEKTWKLGFTTGHGQKPRERSIAARNQTRVLQEVAQAKRRFGLPDPAPVVSGDEAGREGFWLHRFCRPKGSPIMWSIPLPLKSTVASDGPRAMGWTCGSW
jgi:transposase